LGGIGPGANGAPIVLGKPPHIARPSTRTGPGQLKSLFGTRVGFGLLSVVGTATTGGEARASPGECRVRQIEVFEPPTIFQSIGEGGGRHGAGLLDRCLTPGFLGVLPGSGPGRYNNVPAAGGATQPNRTLRGPTLKSLPRSDDARRPSGRFHRQTRALGLVTVRSRRGIALASICPQHVLGCSCFGDLEPPLFRGLGITDYQLFRPRSVRCPTSSDPVVGRRRWLLGGPPPPGTASSAATEVSLHPVAPIPTAWIAGGAGFCPNIIVRQGRVFESPPKDRIHTGPCWVRGGPFATPAVLDRV